MRERRRDAGGIRLRSLLEFAVLFAVGYIAINVGPAVALRIRFAGELEIVANSPIQDSDAELRQKVIDLAEEHGLTLLADRLHVERDRAAKRTVIEAQYQIHILFWPSFRYVWIVQERVEALLL